MNAPYEKVSYRQLWIFFASIALCGILLFALTGITYLDSISTEAGNKFGEDSWTEYLQEFLLLSMSVIALLGGLKYEKSRALLVSIACLTFICFVREFNNKIGDWWKVGVLITLVVYAPYFIKNYKKVFKQLLKFTDSFGMGVFVIGNLIVHTFSRIYGQTYIWANTAGDNYVRSVKNASEESIELLGYTIVFFGVILIAKKARETNTVNKSVVLEKVF